MLPRGIMVPEFSTYHDGGKYACQEKEWINEAKMHEWIDVVLAPWKTDQDKNSMSGEPTLLILDAYLLHQM